jgi:hypothetical protein
MDSDKSIKFDIEGLSHLSARLFDHADRIVNVAAHEMEQDLRVTVIMVGAF